MALGEQMESLADDDFIGFVKKDRHPGLRRDVKKCGNPLCSHLIYFDSYKYGVGMYCDQFCKKEAVMFNVRRKSLLGQQIRKPRQFA